MAIKVLQLCHKPPFPKIDGGCIEMAKNSLLFDQSNSYNLDILTISTNKHPFKHSSFKENLVNSSISNVYLDTSINITGAIKGLLSNTSYHLSRFRSVQYENELLKLFKKNTYDVVWIESIFVGQYIDIIKEHSKAKIILNAPNIEYEIWDRLAMETTNPLKKLYLKKLAKQLKKAELIQFKKIDAIATITERDLTLIKRLFPKKNIFHIPFTVDLKDYPVSYTEEDKLSFSHLGAMNWLPNIEGVKWFIDSVWTPNFLNDNQVTLSLAGKDMPDDLLNLNGTNNISTCGFVDDATEFISSHHVMIAPLFAGGGMRIKIIEAMALGKCVISTSIGAEGIHAKNKKEIIIANSSEEFISAIHNIKNNPALVEEIGRNARKFVEENFNSVHLESKVTKLLNSIDE